MRGPGTVGEVAMVIHAYPPHVGGMELVAEAEAVGLSARGWQVRVLTSSWDQRDLPAPSGYLKVAVPALNLLERRMGVPFPVFSPRLLVAAWRTVRASSVVHLHDVFYLSSWAAGAAGAILRKPLVITQHVDLVPHTSVLVRAVQVGVMGSVGRLLFRRADDVIVLNDRVATFVQRHRGRTSGVRFLPNGVDMARFRPPADGESAGLRHRFNLPDDRMLVLFAGRPVPKKGLPLLVDALDDRFDLVVAGGERGTRRMGGSSIHGLGPVPKEAMPELYRAVDIFCLPSTGEGFPLTVQEAMASGLPVVTTADEAYGAYGLLAAEICLVPASTPSLAEALGRLVSDEGLRQKMGVAARRYAEVHFSWDEHLVRLEAVYRSAMARRPQPGHRASP